MYSSRHRLVRTVLVRHDDLTHPQDALLGGGLVEQVAGAPGVGHPPTWSSTKTSCPVVGRTWATASQRSSR